MSVTEGHWESETRYLRPSNWSQLRGEVVSRIWQTKLIHVSADLIEHNSEPTLDIEYSGLCRTMFQSLSNGSGARTWGAHSREKWIEVRSTGGSARRLLHNDEAGLRRPADISIMYALSAPDSGGANEYVSASRVWARLVAEDQQLAWRLLSVPVRFVESNQDFLAPIFRKTAQGIAVNYNRALIDDPQNQEMVAAFDAFVMRLPATDFIPMPLRRGDAVIWWDAHFLHYRTAAPSSSGLRHFRKASIGECDLSRLDTPPSRVALTMKSLPKKNLVVTKLARILHERKQHVRGRPLIVGFDGACASGKSTLAKMLASEIDRLFSCRTLVIHLDDFHRPRRKRYADSNPAKSFFLDYFEIDRLAQHILEPARKLGVLSKQLTLLDFAADEYTRVMSFDADAATTILVEGVFLFRKELRHLFDYRVYIDIKASTSHARVHNRKLGAEAFSRTSAKFFDRYLPAWISYEAEYAPARLADAIIDNNDTGRPRLSIAAR